MSTSGYLTNLVWHRAQARKLDIDAAMFKELADVFAEKWPGAAEAITQYASICTGAARGHHLSASLCEEGAIKVDPSIVIPPAPPADELLDLTIVETLKRMPFIFRETVMAALEKQKADETAAVAAPPTEKVNELAKVHDNTFIISGRPDLGSFRVANAPAPVPVTRQIVWEERYWQHPLPVDGIIKPRETYDYFWPAKRAQNVVKALDPSIKRQTYNKNIRYLAEKTDMTPEKLLKTNPIPICRKLGLPEHKLRTLLGNYYRLSTGWSIGP
jgi:hypothetical protein